ncbi:cation diffusion facilitator family transporter [Sneathiella sp. CAU 1612]|uniref:Cation diffusion facilitator family transporter n=1 Tax=Sneathiella sedimenti TaxID=2816034 RepID=A0ABS3F539_9PROT|nr:cation diffusion facilitator family transporter [uncultured Sneathiella sp.]MBO0333636.1 cation diffusion facilitator family transporter [Sneathiella sedimenti]
MTVDPEFLHSQNDDAVNGQLMKRATYAAVGIALILIAIKSFAYFATNSVAMLSTLVDSMLDLAASAINLFAVRQSLVPADRDHRFGHGKAEALAGLFQSAIITGSAVFLLFQAGERLLNPKPVYASDVGIIVMVVSIVLTIGLVLYQRYVISRTRSVAISADSLHYVGDVLINGGVILALILDTVFHWRFADGMFGILIALVLIFSAWKIIRTSFADLMDEELGDEERENIKTIVLQQPGVLGIHDLRTRRSGQQVFIQMHIDMDGSISLRDAHTISDAVEARLMAEYPEAEAIVHQDPLHIDNSRNDED